MNGWPREDRTAKCPRPDLCNEAQTCVGRCRQEVTIQTIEVVKNGEAISMCEAVLERLRSGESVAFGFVEVRRGRTVGTGWSRSEVYHLLNSGAARLAHRLASSED